MAEDIRAQANNIPYSPQKVRLVIDLVRGKDIMEALDLLRFVQNKAALPVSKVLASAMANAEENFGVSRDDLMVGCVGLDVDAWQDGFYDPDLPRDWRPAYYSTLLRSVLLPEAEWLQAIASGWAEEVDNDFRIVLRIDSPAGLRCLAGLPGPLQARTVGAVVTAAALGPEQSAAVRFAALRAGTHLPLMAVFSVDWTCQYPTKPLK